MKKVLLLGRGGAGKSTLAHRLSKKAGLPVIELDQVFWSAELTPLAAHEWCARQKELAAQSSWITDGDLGQYDVLAARLPHADTIVVLDLPLLTCVLRALKRSRERWDFWYWMITWRILEKPKIMRDIERHAPAARLFIIRSQNELEAMIGRL